MISNPITGSASSPGSVTFTLQAPYAAFTCQPTSASPAKPKSGWRTPNILNFPSGGTKGIPVGALLSPINGLVADGTRVTQATDTTLVISPPLENPWPATDPTITLVFPLSNGIVQHTETVPVSWNWDGFSITVRRHSRRRGHGGHSADGGAAQLSRHQDPGDSRNGGHPGDQHVLQRAGTARRHRLVRPDLLVPADSRGRYEPVPGGPAYARRQHGLPRDTARRVCPAVPSSSAGHRVRAELRQDHGRDERGRPDQSDRLVYADRLRHRVELSERPAAAPRSARVAVYQSAQPRRRRPQHDRLGQQQPSQHHQPPRWTGRSSKGR